MSSSAAYFGAVKGCTLVAVSSVPKWLVNTIVPNGVAVALDIKEPDGLFVVRSGTSGPSGPSGPSATTTPSFATVDASGVVMRTDRATPFRVFVSPNGLLGKNTHYIQIPAGALDNPGKNNITVLSLVGKNVTQREMSVTPDPSYGLVAA